MSLILKPVMLYGLCTVTPTKRNMDELDVIQKAIAASITGAPKLPDEQYVDFYRRRRREAGAELRRQGHLKWSQEITRTRLNWYGHLARLRKVPGHELTTSAAFNHDLESWRHQQDLIELRMAPRHPGGFACRRWEHILEDFMEWLQIRHVHWTSIADDRDFWKTSVEQYALEH